MNDGEVFLGKEFGHNKTYSEETAAKIDAEVKEYITNGYKKTEEILKEHTFELHSVAQFLFENEKMSGEQFICAMEGKEIPVDEETDDDEDYDLDEFSESEKNKHSDKDVDADSDDDNEE